MIKAETASIITTESYQKIKTEIKNNSLFFIENRLDFEIKRRAAEGYFGLLLYLEETEREIDIHFILDKLREYGYTAKYDEDFQVLEIMW